MHAVVRRGPRAAGAARVAFRAQRHHSGVMIVSPSRLWVRARAGALVLAVCEDERADGDMAEDGGVEQSPCTWQRGMVLSQTPRQRVGDEASLRPRECCRGRFDSPMLISAHAQVLRTNLAHVEVAGSLGDVYDL